VKERNHRGQSGHAMEEQIAISERSTTPLAETTPTSNVVWERFAANPAALFGLGVVILFVCLGLFAGTLAPNNPNMSAGDTFLAPGPGLWMGTDNLGRDVFSRFLMGVRVSLVVGIGAASLSTVVGILVGALAGYLGGWVDVVLMRVADIFLTIPLIVLGLVLAAFFGGSIVNIILIIAFLSWPRSARLVRGEFLALRSREFVQAAVATGSSTLWIVFREILPNALPPVLVDWSLDVGRAVVVEAGISFLGMGDPSAISWGMMLQDAQRFLRQAWWLSVFPGLGIALLALSANLIGEGLNDALNPKLRQH
jgi:peptide/nickel transport system permease protein